MSKPVSVPKIPATIGAAIDALYALHDTRLALTSQAEKAREVEAAFEEAIFNQFKKADLEGARGKRAQATISRREHPTLENADQFYKHLKKHPEDIDLLQRRLSAEAVRARWNEKVAIPGVGKFTSVKLSLTKVKAKK